MYCIYPRPPRTSGVWFTPLLGAVHALASSALLGQVAWCRMRLENGRFLKTQRILRNTPFQTGKGYHCRAGGCIALGMPYHPFPT